MLPAFFLGMYEFLSAPSARRATARRSSRPQSTRYFYPRPPRGGRLPLDAATEYNALFLSTPSARRATSSIMPTPMGRPYFYPRPPRGGRPQLSVQIQHKLGISIHALREEGDPFSVSLWVLMELFLSTPSARRATAHGVLIILDVRISIHALREEGDHNFAGGDALQQRFLSTPSARRATTTCFPASIIFPISIHALREEGDLLHLFIQPSRPLFLSTPSARRATFWDSRKDFLDKHFYPRPPRGGRHQSTRL